MKIKTILILFIIMLLSVSSLVAAYEKAEIVNGDLVIIQKLSALSKPFAIDLGKANFQAGEQMNIKLYIDIDCDKYVVESNSKLRMVKPLPVPLKSWNFKMAVPASCFTWMIKHNMAAPSINGEYEYRYEAINSRTGGVAVKESKFFTVTSEPKACPVDSCTEWKNAYGIDNGLVFTRSCTTYSNVAGCPSKVTGQSQLVCNKGYYKSDNNCISDQADSDGDGIKDSDEEAGNEGTSDENPVESFFESISLLKPAPEGTPLQDKLNFPAILIILLLAAGFYLWRNK